MCLFYSFVCEICKQKLLAHLLGDELAHWSYFMTPIYTHINDVICREPKGIFYNRYSISLTYLLQKTKSKPFNSSMKFKIYWIVLKKNIIRWKTFNKEINTKYFPIFNRKRQFIPKVLLHELDLIPRMLHRLTREWYLLEEWLRQSLYFGGNTNFINCEQ